ncbi:MAG: terminase family protein, partial [Bacillota bacterium]
MAIIAGTGGGKTWFGVRWLWREIYRQPQGDFLVVAPTYKALKRIALPQTLEFLDATIGGQYRAVDQCYDLRTGGHVYFGSAEKPLTLEGVHCRAAWMDEAGQMRREAWAVVKRRVGYHLGRVLITTTPYNSGWLKTEFYDLWQQGDTDYTVVNFPSIWNPTYPREEFERAREREPEWRFRMFWLGQFARPEGLVYQDFRGPVEPVPIPREWDRIIGVDFGFTVPAAAVFIAVDPKTETGHVYREVYARGWLASELGERLAAICKEEGITPRLVACDPSEPGDIEELRRAGLPAKAADNAVMEGISEVIRGFRTGRLVIHRGLVNLLDEIEQYRWKTGADGRPKDEPV